MKKIDLIRKRFGKLTVLSYAGVNQSKKSMWLCKCDCGNEKVIRGNDLQTGNTQSCGCIHSEQVAERNRQTAKKNDNAITKTRLYSIWRGMVKRCHNPSYREFKYYGGRGIKVCDEWRKFKNFYDDMFGTYDDTLTIERLDVNGDYCKDNCMWATREEQANNRRGNVFITVDGITDTVSRTCRRYNVKYSVVSTRLRNGWEPERAIKTPIKKHIKSKGA